MTGGAWRSRGVQGAREREGAGGKSAGLEYPTRHSLRGSHKTRVNSTMKSTARLCKSRPTVIRRSSKSHWQSPNSHAKVAKHLCKNSSNSFPKVFQKSCKGRHTVVNTSSNSYAMSVQHFIIQRSSDSYAKVVQKPCKGRATVTQRSPKSSAKVSRPHARNSYRGEWVATGIHLFVLPTLEQLQILF